MVSDEKPQPHVGQGPCNHGCMENEAYTIHYLGQSFIHQTQLLYTPITLFCICVTIKSPFHKLFTISWPHTKTHILFAEI